MKIYNTLLILCLNFASAVVVAGTLNVDHCSDCGKVLVGAARIEFNKIRWEGSATSFNRLSVNWGNPDFGFTAAADSNLSMTPSLLTYSDGINQLAEPNKWLYVPYSLLSIESTTSDARYMGFFFAPVKHGKTSLISFAYQISDDKPRSVDKSLIGEGIADNDKSPYLGLNVGVEVDGVAKESIDDFSFSNKTIFTIAATRNPNVGLPDGSPVPDYAMVELEVVHKISSGSTECLTTDVIQKQTVEHTETNYYHSIMGEKSGTRCNRNYYFLVSIGKPFTFTASKQRVSSEDYVDYRFYIRGHYDSKNPSKYPGSHKTFRLRTGGTVTPQPTTKTLNITVTGNGTVSSTNPTINCSGTSSSAQNTGTCSANVPEGTTGILLQATPNTNVKWDTTACPNGQVTMTSDVNCTVTFIPVTTTDNVDVTIKLKDNVQQVSIFNIDTNQQIKSCDRNSTPCEVSVPKGTSLKITPTATDSTYSFSWVDCAGSVENDVFKLNSISSPQSCSVTAIQSTTPSGLKAVLSDPIFTWIDDKDKTEYKVTYDASKSEIQQDIDNYSVKVYRQKEGSLPEEEKDVFIEEAGNGGTLPMNNPRFSLKFDSKQDGKKGWLNSANTYLVSLTVTDSHPTRPISKTTVVTLSPSSKGFVDFEFTTNARRVSLKPVNRLLNTQSKYNYYWWCDDAPCKLPEGDQSSNVENLQLTPGEHTISLVVNGGHVEKQIIIPENQKPAFQSFSVAKKDENNQSKFELNVTATDPYPDGGLLTYAWSKDVNNQQQPSLICEATQPTTNSASCLFSLDAIDIQQLKAADSPSITFGVEITDDDQQFTAGTEQAHSNSNTKQLSLMKLKADFSFSTTDGKTFNLASTSQPSKFEVVNVDSNPKQEDILGIISSTTWKKDNDSQPTQLSNGIIDFGNNLGKHTVTLSVTDSFGFEDLVTKNILVASELIGAVNVTCPIQSGESSCNIQQEPLKDTLFSGALLNGKDEMLSSPTNPAKVMISINFSSETNQNHDVDVLLVIAKQSTQGDECDKENEYYSITKENPPFKRVNLCSEPSKWMPDLGVWEKTKPTGTYTTEYTIGLDKGNYYIFAGYRRKDGSIVHGGGDKGPLPIVAKFEVK